MVPLLEVQGLRVDYPDIVAVDALDLTLHAGDACALIGPNGAGKTSTMRAIAGLQDITFGTIRVAGRDLAEADRLHRRRLGYMQDNSPLYERLTVLEYLDHYARAYELAGKAERIAACLELTGLSEKRNALCGSLSRGMKQRLVLARTILPDPDVLLLDEPASGLDPLSRIELRKLILSLRTAGKALVVSSHILGEISEFCNRMAVMERGRLRVGGDIETLASELVNRRMRVRWRPTGADPLPLLKDAPIVSGIRVDGNTAELQVNGAESQRDDLLVLLVQNGVRVAEWGNAGDSIEEIFMQIGAREVQ